jgi:CHAT domain-containing protein
LAEKAESEAVQIQNDADREKWLIDLGRANFVLREYSKAETDYGKALAIAASLNDSDAMSRCLNDLIQLALERRDLSTAERYWKEESALSLGPDRKIYVSFDAAGIAMQRKELAKAEGLLEAILKSKANDPLRLITERELGIVYWQEGRIKEADRAFREAIKDVEDTIAKIPPQYQMSFLDQDPFYDSYVRFLVAEGRILEALKIAERGRAQILSQATRYGQRRRSAFSLETVEAALKRRNQIALAYSLTNEESFVWVITPTQLKVRRLPSHEVLGLQVDAYNKEITGSHRSIEESSAGQELYKALVQPVESLLPKGSRVVVISSKVLSVLSFESLIVPGPHPHYWIDDVEIETAGSLALLARPRAAATKSASSKKDLLLLGAPVEADKAFPFLLNASDEMDRVRSHFPANQQTVISGKDAVPQSYRASNPGEYRFIHIDAHSAASELNPLKSFVVLSPTPQHSYKLFADEITETPLRADLVTLSACYGAGTRWYNGEGIVGLGWAFLRAGAHQVVASLWTVDDASTPQLMDDFYGELSKGKSAAEALRAAKLKMLHSDGQRNRPYYWASLQLYTGS